MAKRNTAVAPGPDYKFVQEMLTFGDSYEPHVGDVVQVYKREPFKRELTGTVVKTGETLTVRHGRKEVEVDTEAKYVSIESSPTIEAVWNDCMTNERPDGVAYSDSLVPEALKKSLSKSFDAMVKKEKVDYHPGSGTRVRDLVHPSLYPYVRKKAPGETPKYDRFGRVYEDSKYQWLPSQFHVAANGAVEIRSYINNLPAGYDALQSDLAKLFSCALPLLESVLGYVDKMRFFVNDDPEIEHEGELPEDDEHDPIASFPSRKLRGRELQVIPKIVEYKLAPGETHEGVWHVEGMSHEHVVATCVYVLSRDAKLEGGDLEFKRACTVEEAGAWFWGMDQLRPAPAQQLVEAAEIPLGRIATPEGRLFVFPNSHIHKLKALVPKGKKAVRRRVIVFWVVDPDAPIVSTRDVPPQQGVMKRAEALSIRLKLMKERKRHKANFNVRSISLCEH